MDGRLLSDGQVVAVVEGVLAVPFGHGELLSVY